METFLCKFNEFYVIFAENWVGSVSIHKHHNGMFESSNARSTFPRNTLALEILSFIEMINVVPENSYGIFFKNSNISKRLFLLV